MGGMGASIPSAETPGAASHLLDWGLYIVLTAIEPRFFTRLPRRVSFIPQFGVSTQSRCNALCVGGPMGRVIYPRFTGGLRGLGGESEIRAGIGGQLA